VVSFTDVSEAYAAFLFGIEVVRVYGNFKPSPFPGMAAQSMPKHSFYSFRS
jgi:hypothetical protein